MKKIFTLLVMVALAACWTSCSDDDDKNEPDPTIPTMNEIILSIDTGTGGMGKQPIQQHISMR